MSEINEGIKKHQEQKRKETIKLIENAIKDIKDFEGEFASINVKKLQEYTNLSRSALYKEHALKVWNPHLWEERYITKSKAHQKLEMKFSKDYDLLNKEIEKLNHKILAANKKITKLENDLLIEKKRREVKEIEIEEYKEKNMKLLAECQKLQNQLHLRG